MAVLTGFVYFSLSVCVSLSVQLQLQSLFHVHVIELIKPLEAPNFFSCVAGCSCAGHGITFIHLLMPPKRVLKIPQLDINPSISLF
jgi:hypothetical protein